VVARGAVHRGGGPRGIATEALGGLLEQLRREEAVRGVVLRLESPGGDGVASDLLWRGLSLVAREKPVVVSMGEVVASGGYYLAAAADAVFAEAATITGSIGVVGGKVDLAGLYRRVGIGKEGVERGARAGLLSEARGFTADERAAVQGMLDSVYDTFVERVAEGRKLAPEAVDKAARGRIWSGSRAHSLGLVDELGGPLEALLEVRRRAGLRDDERFLLDLHPRLPTLPGLALLRRWRPGFSASW
jgi:protease-4